MRQTDVRRQTDRSQTASSLNAPRLLRVGHTNALHRYDTTDTSVSSLHLYNQSTFKRSSCNVKRPTVMHVTRLVNRCFAASVPKFTNIWKHRSRRREEQWSPAVNQRNVNIMVECDKFYKIWQSAWKKTKKRSSSPVVDPLTVYCWWDRVLSVSQVLSRQMLWSVDHISPGLVKT